MKKLPTEARRRRAGWLLAALAFALLMTPEAQILCTLPDSVSLTRGYEGEFSLPWPVSVEYEGVLASGDESYAGAEGVKSSPENDGEMTVSLLGLFPIKKMAVNVRPERVLVPGGRSIGVAIKMDGVLIVGASDLSGSVPSPARLAGLKAGDIIEAVNGVAVRDSGHLSELISGGSAAKLTINRNDSSLEVTIDPIYDERDGVYRLGVWVRDSTAGVGTLSYYDPYSGCFAALGHAISDIDTGSLLTVGEGEIFESAISRISKGTSGSPGELVGEFVSGSESLGEITKNTPYGIYGDAYDFIQNSLYPDGIPVKYHDEVKLGKAQILTTLDGEGVKAYDVQITKLNDQSAPAQRSMVISVTDPELISRTGGIVQGMSGSPIIQDGRLVGAVTHVFINDPTQGFGVYIDWMLEQSDSAALRAA